MFKLTFTICCLFGFTLQEVQNSLKQQATCNEMPESKLEAEISPSFRSGQRGRTEVPKSITFKTDIGLSQDLVKQFKTEKKAKKYIRKVIEHVNKLFQHKSLETKVIIKAIKWEVRNKDFHATEQNLENLNKEKNREESKLPYGAFGASKDYIATDPASGYAYVGTACKKGWNGYIVEMSGNNIKMDGALLAHEIGHLLGMHHNEDKFAHPDGCTRIDEWWNVMDGQVRHSSKGWTTCNTDKFKTFLQGGRGDCLIDAKK